VSSNIPGEQDRSAAELYIETLTGCSGTPVTFQTFVDGKGHSGRLLYGTLDEHWDRLVELNNGGHGIFMMVNEGDQLGRKAENVLTLRALFTDDDGKAATATFEKSEEGALRGPSPSMTVQSKAGEHNYFLLLEGEPLEEFTPAQKKLARYFDTDPAVHDLPRVMRVPGFFHMKDPQEPFLVKIVQTSDRKYRINEIVAAYSPKPPAGAAGDRTETAKLHFARAYVASVPGAVQGQRGDQATFALCCALARGFALTDEEALEVLRPWNEQCRPPWSEGELIQKLQNARRHGKEPFGAKIRARSSSVGGTSCLAFLVPQERYVYLRADGCWDLGTLVGGTGAYGHLISTGCTPERAAQIIKKKTCVIAHGTDCRPGAGPVFEEDDRVFLNSYLPSKIVPRAQPWPTIERLLDTVTGGDRVGRDWVFNWMAFKVQNPGLPNTTALVLQGPHGTGKSLLGTILSHIIGVGNEVRIGQGDLEGSFNEPYVGKLLVLADEVVNRDNVTETSSKLKQMITEPTILMNGKHKTQRHIENRMTWIFTSNSTTPVRVEGSTDRRYTVFATRVPPSKEYEEKLKSLFAGGQPTAEFRAELEGFAFALQSHVVDELQVRRPYHNAARAELAAASMSGAEVFFAEVVERGILALVRDAGLRMSNDWNFKERGVTADATYQAYRAFCDRNGFAVLNSSKLGKELTHHHPEWKRVRLPGPGRPWGYLLPREGRESAA
jgi:hypothetical protein